MMRRPLGSLCPAPRGWYLRVVLALVIALTPLGAGAASLAMQMPDPASTPAERASMPCHSAAAAQLADNDCPHCNGDAGAAQCHCSAVPMPSGVATPVLPLIGDTTGNGLNRTMTSDALPDSPGELLFRPPRSHA